MTDAAHIPDRAGDPPLTPSWHPRLAVPVDLLATLYEILDATILVLQGKFGNIQLYDPARGALCIAAQRGFPEAFLQALHTVSIDDGTAGARSLRHRQRVIISDVDQDAGYAPYRHLAALAGYRAVQSTPLLARDGEFLGALLTHLPEARDFSVHELHVLDLYSRQAADAIVRSRVERDLATVRRRLDTALKAGDMGLYVWDMATDRVYGDASYQRMVDMPFDEHGFASREALAELIHPDDRAERVKRVNRAIETGEPYEAEYRFRSGGRTRWVMSRGIVEYDQSGKPAHFAGVLVDITERKRAEEALKEADRQKDTFLAQLGHELRNPLAPILNAALMFRAKQSVDPDTLWATDMIDRQVRHLTRLVDDLLDVSRISRNRLELRRQPTGLEEIVRGAIEVSRPAIEGKGHELRVVLSPEPVRLFADSARLTQALMNLLINAAKYTDPGGRIELAAGLEGGEAVIRVRDNGIGIEPSALPSVFQVFYQVDASLERSQGGLGIGLSLVKSVVELHGGSVEAHSNGIGEGSEFVVRLPAHAVDGSQPASAADAQRGPAAAIARRVLVVDDNRDAADSLAMLLRVGGHIVQTAYDGQSALETAVGFKPDAALIDLAMPKVNGYEVCRRIRETDWGKNSILIAQTGWGQEDHKRRTREAGFDQHFVKPVDPTTIMKVIEGGKGSSDS